MDSLSLDPYFKLAGQPALSGKITGKIQAGGRVDRIDDMTVTADIFDAALVLNRQPLLTLGPATASWHAGHFTLPGVRIDFEAGGMLMIRGEGSLNHDLDFEADGSIPFGIISALSDDIRAADGTLHITAFARGTIQDPVLQADLVFENLSLSTDVIESGFSHISGHIRATPGDLEIIRFSGRLDKGRYELGGRAGIGQGGLNDFDLKLDAHQLVLDFPNLLELTLDSRLVLSGTPEKSLLTGDIVLMDGRYYRDVELDLLGTATRRTRRTQPVEPKEQDGFLNHMSLNVDIHHRGLLLVENNLATLQVSPDITIQGTAHTPLISGRTRVDSGIITFQKKEFEVKKGIIDFINPYRIEPVIDIAGEMSVRSWIITLTVSGTPDNLDLQFSSVPSESHADIISLIAFGKTTREMGNAGGGQFSPEEFVSGLLADSLQKNLQDATGIDELKISTDSRNESGTAGVQVTVGKELSRQMSVAYGVDIRDGETVQRVITYYKLMENLLLSGYQDTGGKFGGEIKYRLEFR
jgi:translocation and assembly module TamB